MCCGGFVSQTKDDALNFVRSAMGDVVGFKDVTGTGSVPKVVFAEFTSNEAMFEFVRTQKSIEAFIGLWADKKKSKTELTVHKTLGKIKRAICEEGRVEGRNVIIDRLSRRVYWVIGGLEIGGVCLCG